MKAIYVTALALMVSPTMLGQVKPAKPRPAVTAFDQLGMTCAQILQMPSAEWIGQFKTKTTAVGSEQDKTQRATVAYGKCYDARTDRIAAALGKRGAGPLMGGRAAFRDFEGSLLKFESQALSVTDPPAGDMKKAYAALYEKQFRYAFFKAAEDATVKPSATKIREGAKPAPKPPIPANSGAIATNNTVPAKTDEPAAPDVDEITEAKNRFGELLDALPDDQMHALHSSFGDIISGDELNGVSRLAIYQYAIFLLEPPSEQPFSPPPF
jgi:hypothetical protein